MTHTSKKLRNSARNEQCTFAIPGVCNHDTATTVLCHAPSGVSGMGLKSNDWWAAYGCSSCHTAMDLHQFSSEIEREIWMKAIHNTWERLIKKGLIIVPVTIPKETKTPPRPPRRLYAVVGK